MRLGVVTIYFVTSTALFLVVEARNSKSKYKEVLSLLRKYIDEQENKDDDVQNQERKSVDEKLFNDQIQEEIIETQERQAVDPCGLSQPLVLSTATGTILSPGYTNSKYTDNSKCSWKIVAPPGQQVIVTFNNLNIEQGNECMYDAVSIWDVQNAAAVLIGKYCGNYLPVELLKSSGPVIYIYFTTDGVDSTGRFSLSWTVVSASAVPSSSKPCGTPYYKPNINNRIVNGDVAVPHSWPWQISLRLVIGSKQYHVCGGTVVSNSVVITASHCLFDENHKPYPAQSFVVVAGDHDQMTTSDGAHQSTAVSKIISHAQYDARSSSSPFDIAVLLLQTNLNFNNNVSAACLPVEDVAMKSVCYATGWGETQDTGDETVLRQVRLPIVSNTQCRQNNYYGPQIQDSMLCAGYEAGGKDACQGDSGGPFVCLSNNKWYLQGVTSFGAGCAQPKKPGVYTRVTDYLDWIYSKSGVSP